jgi:hypothetical protein
VTHDRPREPSATQPTGRADELETRPGCATVAKIGDEPDITHFQLQTSIHLWAFRMDQLTVESAAATAKPRTVSRPATLPAWRAASGIMESISMTNRAPAANPLMAA